MNILEKKHIHFIGIGGIGNSALAQMLHVKGAHVSGSDSTPSDLTKRMQKSGIKVSIGHKAENVTRKNDLVIYTPAIPKDNVELVRAKELKLPLLSYPEALGELTKKYFTIAVSGSHGKSTTTAMTSLVLAKAGLDPNVVIGTKIREFKNQNYRVGKSKYLVIEACEYKRSFLNFHPDILIITNIDLDHLDYYKNLKDYQRAFEQMCGMVKKGGKIILNIDDKNSLFLLKKFTNIVTVSMKKKSADFYLDGFLIRKKNTVGLHVKPHIPGDFNLMNAAFAAIVGNLLNASNKKIEQTIMAYKGSWRRLEIKKKMGKTLFIDDYGHHPTEIKATLKAIHQSYPKAKMLCIFQPHQHNRTKMLLKEFGKSFTVPDKVIVPNIYKVRDSKKDIESVSTEMLVKEISKFNRHVSNGGDLKKTADYITKNHKQFDLIVTMGAGDINDIYKMF